ncbi:MAG: DMT family transporter [Saprospiraceae bacterium]|nr:DMT family transporter [Saprospiraceae bacterium]MCB9323596.1 DMT family transporter [Lewinellaceae bacterium]
MKVKSIPVSENSLGLILVMLGAVAFSSKAVLVKLAYREGIDALNLLTLRMLFALPFYVLLAYFTSRQAAYKLTKKDFIFIGITGILGYYLASLFDFWGLEYITASMERLVLFAYPSITLIFGAVFFKTPIVRSQYVALIFTYLGIFVIFAGDVSIESQKDLIIGGVLVFTCAITYSLYLTGSGFLIPKIGAIRYTAYALIFAAFAVFFHYFLARDFHLFDFSARIYGLSLIMAIVATVIPTLLVSYGIRLIGAGNTALTSSIGPVSTLTLAYFLLGERLSLVQVLGSLLILAGVLYLSAAKNKK